MNPVYKKYFSVGRRRLSTFGTYNDGREETRMVGATLVWSPSLERCQRPPVIAWILPDRGGGAAAWSGDFLVADWDRRPERRRPRRRLGSASFRAPGMATWSGDSAGERCDPAGHKGCPCGHRGLGVSKKFPTLAKNTGRLETAFPVGDWKSPLLGKNTGAWKDAPPSRRVKHAAPGGRLEIALPGEEYGRLERRPSQSARETRRSRRERWM